MKTNSAFFKYSLLGLAMLASANASIIIRPTDVSVNTTGDSDTPLFLPNTINDTSLSSGGSTVANGVPVPGTMPTLTLPGDLSTAGWTAYWRVNWQGLATNSNIDNTYFTIFTYTLPSTEEIDGIYLWNYSEVYLDQWENDRGFNSVTLTFSTDGVNYGSAVNLTFDQAPQTVTYAPQFRSFAGVEASYVRMTVNSGHGDIAGITGYNKLMFTAVPEPSTIALAAIGLSAALLRVRRRSKTGSVG